MATYRQLTLKRTKRLKKIYKKRTQALEGCPQKRGVINRIAIESPKKPNSAKRRVAKVVLCTDKRVRVFIPGEGLGNLQRFSRILIRGGRARDLPGVRYRIIRGLLDAEPCYVRRNARSKYGVKKMSPEELQKFLPKKKKGQD